MNHISTCQLLHACLCGIIIVVVLWRTSGYGPHTSVGFEHSNNKNKKQERLMAFFILTQHAPSLVDLGSHVVHK